MFSTNSFSFLHFCTDLEESAFIIQPRCSCFAGGKYCIPIILLLFSYFLFGISYCKGSLNFNTKFIYLSIIYPPIAHDSFTSFFMFNSPFFPEGCRVSTRSQNHTSGLSCQPGTVIGPWGCLAFMNGSIHWWAKKSEQTMERRRYSGRRDLMEAVGCWDLALAPPTYSASASCPLWGE